MEAYIEVVRRSLLTSAPRDYVGVLDRIHKELLPRTYLEIGVADGTSFRVTQPGTVRVGVDPRPKIVLPDDPLTHLLTATSDDFFSSYDLRQLLGGATVDLVFIDGMHLFEYALRDFMNVEPFCHPRSVILFHDCCPIDAATSTREPTPGKWSGDVWKVLVALREYRPELRFATIDVPPTGLSVVTGVDPSSAIVRERYGEIVDELSDIDYSVLSSAKAETLNLVPNDWNAVRALLPPPFRTGRSARPARRRIAVERCCRGVRRRVAASPAAPVSHGLKRRLFPGH